VQLKTFLPLIDSLSKIKAPQGVLVFVGSHRKQR